MQISGFHFHIPDSNINVIGKYWEQMVQITVNTGKY